MLDESQAESAPKMWEPPQTSVIYAAQHSVELAPNLIEATII